MELEINSGRYGIIAFVAKEELSRGEERIYLGGEKGLRELVYPSWTDDVIPDIIDTLIIHESVHIVIYKVTQSSEATTQLDNIDNQETEFGISRSLHRKVSEIEAA